MTSQASRPAPRTATSDIPTSRGNPYDSWPAPVTVKNDLSKTAQGYAAMKVEGGQINTIWEDHRQSPARLPNILYDISRIQ